MPRQKVLEDANDSSLILSTRARQERRLLAVVCKEFAFVTRYASVSRGGHVAFAMHILGGFVGSNFRIIQGNSAGKVVHSEGEAVMRAVTGMFKVESLLCTESKGK